MKLKKFETSARFDVAAPNESLAVSFWSAASSVRAVTSFISQLCLLPTDANTQVTQVRHVEHYTIYIYTHNIYQQWPSVTPPTQNDAI